MFEALYVETQKLRQLQAEILIIQSGSFSPFWEVKTPQNKNGQWGDQKQKVQQ